MKCTFLRLVMLLFCFAGLPGCGADRSVQVPEEPAPMPSAAPETATASSPDIPADTAAEDD